MAVKVHSVTAVGTRLIHHSTTVKNVKTIIVMTVRRKETKTRVILNKKTTEKIQDI